MEEISSSIQSRASRRTFSCRTCCCGLQIGLRLLPSEGVESTLWTSMWLLECIASSTTSTEMDCSFRPLCGNNYNNNSMEHVSNSISGRSDDVLHPRELPHETAGNQALAAKAQGCSSGRPSSRGSIYDGHLSQHQLPLTGFSTNKPVNAQRLL